MTCLLLLWSLLPLPLHTFIIPLLPCSRSLLTISLDIYLHRLVLSRQSRSSSYSLFPSYSFSFYDDASLRLGQALLGLCTLSSLYIYKPVYFLYSLSNFDLLNTASNIPRSLTPCLGSLLVFIVLLSRRFLRTFETPVSILMLEPLRKTLTVNLCLLESTFAPTRVKHNNRCM